MTAQKISYPEWPEGVSLAHFQGIKKNWRFSVEILERLHQQLNEEMKNQNVSVVVAGSFGRLEASSESDLDFMIISETHLEPNEEKQVIATIRKVASSFQLRLPNPEGVFSSSIILEQMLQNVGGRLDDLVSLAQRMLLLMEARPIYNERTYKTAVDHILRKYLELVIQDPRKEALFLLNDVIRYLRSICVNYQFQFWKEEDKWVIRNVKLRHSRIIMYAGLLLLIMNASKNQHDKLTYLSSKIPLTPIEKVAHVYSDNGDPSIDRVLGPYDVFLRKISDPQVRGALQAEYDDRYLNSQYADLRVNSDALQVELTRFIHARRGVWTDQIYEYLIF